MATIGMVNSRDTDKKIGAFAYISSASATTVTSAGTYYPILGTFTNPLLEQFSVVGDPALQYDGASTYDMEVDWHAAVSCNNAARHVTLGIKKVGGSAETASLVGTTCKTATDEYSLSGTCVLSVANGDKIQLVLTSDNDGDEVTVQHYTTTIRPFFF